MNKENKMAAVAGLALGLATVASAQATLDTTKTAAPDSSGHKQKMQKLDSHMQTVVPNDAIEMIAIRKLGNRRPLAGEIIAEIQVILGGTPAYISDPRNDSPFYEEKKEPVVRVKVK